MKLFRMLRWIKNNIEATIAIAVASILVMALVLPENKSSDAYLTKKVIKLLGSRSMCSGEQIKAPSGQNYILTAAHCKGLAVNGQISVKTEDGRELSRRIIAEDPHSDLLLLEGIPGMEGIEISKTSKRGDWVRTLTHGNNLDTYKTEGTLIQETLVVVPISIIENERDQDECASMDKYFIAQTLFGDLCVLKAQEVVTTALIVPGSSGGMVVNSSGQLVGVVSAGDGKFGYLVRLIDIQNFTSNY